MTAPRWLKAVLAFMALIYFIDFLVFKEGFHAILAAIGFSILFCFSVGSILNVDGDSAGSRSLLTVVFSAGVALVIASFVMKWQLLG